MLGVRLAGIAVVALATASCVLRIEDNQNDGGGGTTGTKPELCPAETYSAADRQAIYQQAADNLDAAGHPLDGLVWTDAARFSEFITEVYKAAGCTPPDGTSPQALGGGEAPEYFCGPGHGTASIWHPAVSDCLNSLCKEHDACYAMCSASTEGCAWATNTGPCDGPFLQQIGSCPDEAGTTFASGAVVFLANLLDFGGKLFSCGDMQCPALGELGSGVCSMDASGTDCTNCLKYTDRGATCLDRACSGTLDDPICYAANCPQVGECYGGYGKGVPGGATPPTPVSDPDSVTWTLHVSDGDIPESKPDGNYWDVDFFGFDPPDPYVDAHVGQVKGQTSEREDTLHAHWDEPVLTGLAAADLRAGITFYVWDSDLVNDDYVGSCYFEMSNDTFNADHLQPTCDVDGLALVFYTTPDLPSP